MVSGFLSMDFSTPRIGNPTNALTRPRWLVGPILGRWIVDPAGNPKRRPLATSKQHLADAYDEYRATRS